MEDQRFPESAFTAKDIRLGELILSESEVLPGAYQVYKKTEQGDYIGVSNDSTLINKILIELVKDYVKLRRYIRKELREIKNANSNN